MRSIAHFLLLFAFTISAAIAREGGATSGGGDFFGIDAAKIADHVFQSIEKIGPKLYSGEDLEIIREIKNELKIVMADGELPASVSNVVQNGSAFSIRENKTATMFLNKKQWNESNSLLKREALIHHEIMVMAGIETTGEYELSIEFEKLRKNFWKLTVGKSVFCTINVFEKSRYYHKDVPGKLLGSSSSLMPFTGAKGDMGVLASLSDDKALIWRGVIDSAGFFKMQIEEARYYSFIKASKRNPLDPTTIDLGTTVVKESVRTYFNPYHIEEPVANPMFFGDNFAVVVNCNQF